MACQTTPDITISVTKAELVVVLEQALKDAKTRYEKALAEHDQAVGRWRAEVAKRYRAAADRVEAGKPATTDKWDPYRVSVPSRPDEPCNGTPYLQRLLRAVKADGTEKYRIGPKHPAFTYIVEAES